MKHHDPYDLTEEECAVRREWYILALEAYESNHDQAEEFAVFGALVGGDFRRLGLDHQRAIKEFVGRLAETLAHPSGNKT